ncbi:hypothetical protein B296_00057065, partial [Ensete ventricosum]
SATHGQGPLQGGNWLRPGPTQKGGQRCPQGVTVSRRSRAYGGSSHPRARPLIGRRPKRGSVARRPQGAVAHSQPYCQQGRRRQSQGWLPLSRADASVQGQPSPEQGQQRLRRRKGGKRG